MTQAEHRISIDDERIRVTTWTFPEAGATTGPHVHEHDYVVVPVTGGTFVVTAADGERRELTQQAGVPYQGVTGTAHEVVNGTDSAAEFVEVELKTAPE
jgi:quercetin dioxygenase-like cupin family protein